MDSISGQTDNDNNDDIIEVEEGKLNVHIGSEINCVIFKMSKIMHATSIPSYSTSITSLGSYTS